MSQSVQSRTAKESIIKPSGILQLGFLQNTSRMIEALVATERAKLNQLKQELSIMDPSKLHIHKRADGRLY